MGSLFCRTCTIPARLCFTLFTLDLLFECGQFASLPLALEENCTDRQNDDNDNDG